MKKFFLIGLLGFLFNNFVFAICFSTDRGTICYEPHCYVASMMAYDYYYVILDIISLFIFFHSIFILFMILLEIYKIFRIKGDNEKVYNGIYRKIKSYSMIFVILMVGMVIFHLIYIKYFYLIFDFITDVF